MADQPQGHHLARFRAYGDLPQQIGVGGLHAHVREEPEPIGRQPVGSDAAVSGVVSVLDDESFGAECGAALPVPGQLVHLPAADDEIGRGESERRVDMMLLHRGSIELQPQPGLATQRLEHRASGVGHLRHPLLHLPPHRLQALRACSDDSNPDRGSHTRGRHHVHPCACRRTPGARPAWRARRLIELVDELRRRLRLLFGPDEPKHGS